MADKTELKRLERERRVKAGFRRLELWARPHNHERIKTYAAKVEKQEAWKK